MSDTPDEKLARIERGLNALFAAEVVEDILETIDFEALLSDEPVEDPIDVERLASALGRPLGRVLAARVVDNGGLAGALTKTVGSEFGSRVASRALRVAAENLDTDGATNLAAIEDALPGSTAEGLTDAETAASLGGEVAGGATGAGSAADDGGWTEIGVSGPDDDDVSNPQDGSTDGHDAADDHDDTADGHDAADGHDDAADARADSSADEDEEKN